MPDSETAQTTRHHRAGLLLLLVAYLVLGNLYASQTPLFESPDESSHLQVILHIARNLQAVEAPLTGPLPSLPPYQMPARRADSGPNMAWAVGYHDPPLYYAPPLYHALAALVTLATSRGEPMADLPARLIPNPSWDAGYAPVRGSDGWNKNIFVHLPTETWSQSPTVRTATLLRGFSIILGAVTIWCTYNLARQLAPRSAGWALGAAAMVALNPQFIAGHASVSNDPLSIALCSLTLLGMLALLRRRAAWTSWAFLGVAAGVAALTKQSALLLVPVCGLSALASAIAGRQWTREGLLAGVGRGAALGLAAALIGGPWYVHNLVRHGDPLGTAPHYAAQVALARFDWEALLGTLESYWAAFGWALITLPGWVYAVVAAVVLVALAGLVRSVLQGGGFRAGAESRDWGLRWGAGLLVLSVALNVASFVGWATATGAPYGRLLFPTIAPVSVLLAWGLAQWRGRGFRLGVWAASIFAVLVAAAAPWTALRPAFHTPYQPHGVRASAHVMEDVNFRVGAGTVSLVGYEAVSVGRDDVTLAPGESARATLYWRADAPPGELLTVWAQLGSVDPEARVAEDTRWLGGTLYPSSFWRSGDVVAHAVTLAVPDWAPAPSLYWLRVGVQDEGARILPLTDGANDYVVLGPWRVRAKASPALPATATPLEARLGEAIRLIGYEAFPLDGVAVEMRLYWETVAAPGADTTVFVHLVDEAGTLLAQHDAPPAAGAYPTSWWLPGDLVEDRHPLVLPEGAGDVLIYVGMYDPATGIRLPAMGAGGERYPGDAVPLAD